MISPLAWILKRPGLLIPVFFLQAAQGLVRGQNYWPEASSAALGGAYVTRAGFFSASLNQAGLGEREKHSLSLQHSRPYLLRELGQTSLSGQFIAGKGGLGIVLSTQGIKGLRQSSLWLSYGMRLSPGLCAGLGMHFWNSSMPEQVLYASGVSFALGIRARINQAWTLGAHVLHPASWDSLPLPPATPSMIIAAGFSYTFMKSASMYSEIHVKPEQGIVLVEGLEWHLKEGFSMSTGFSDKPLSFSWGLSLLHSLWNIQFAFQYRVSSGTVPLASLSHAW